MESDILAVFIESVGKTFGVGQNSVYRGLKPLFDIPADQITGEDIEKKSGDQGKGNEKQQEFDFELGTHHFVFSFQVQFDKVAAQNEKKNQKQQQHNNLKGGQQDVHDRSGGNLAGLPDDGFDGEKKNNE